MIPLRRPAWLKRRRSHHVLWLVVALLAWLVAAVAEYFVCYGLDRYMTK